MSLGEGDKRISFTSVGHSIYVEKDFSRVMSNRRASGPGAGPASGKMVGAADLFVSKTRGSGGYEL